MSELELLEAALKAGQSIGVPVSAAVLLQDPFNRLVGPTADYLGESLRDFVKNPKNRHLAVHLVKTLSVAVNRLGNKMQEPGQIPLRVARTILTEAAYSESDIVTQYLGGVLASSRTPDGRDDRGVKFAKIVIGLSSYQLRAHFLIYSTISKLFLPTDLLRTHVGQNEMAIMFSHEKFAEAVDMSETERKNQQIWSHIFDGLIGEHIIKQPPVEYHIYPSELTASEIPDPDGEIIACYPTPLGIELFLWAFGHSDKELNFIFTQDFEIEGIPNRIPDVMTWPYSPTKS